MSRLLVVEDDQDIALALRVVLEGAGHEVSEAGDGWRALHAVQQTGPDLVLLDVGLPGIDGWEVLARIRDLSDVPVLMLSAHGDAVERENSVGHGADDYLGKPFRIADLLTRVDGLLGRPAGAQEPRPEG